MKCSASVTFEYPLRAPETWTGDGLEGQSPAPIARRALATAKKSLRPRGWTSLVVVLQRDDAGEAADV